MKKTYVSKEKDTMNARINVNYTGTKPKVIFTYPDKKNQVKINSRGMVTTFWLIFLLLAAGIPYIYNSYRATTEEHIQNARMFNQTTECKNLVLDNYRMISDKICEQIVLGKNNTYTNLWKKLSAPAHIEDVSLKSGFTFLFMLWFVLYGIPWVIWRLFRKKWDALLPKWQAFGHSRRVAIFKPKAIETRDGRYCFELPMFHNMALEYEATKDCSKYLTEVDVREHPFIKYVKYEGKNRRYKSGKMKGKLKPRYTVNEWLWRVRFYYSQKPKNGTLWMRYN